MYGKIDVKMRQNRLVLPQNQFILRHLRIECGVWVLLFDVYKRRAVRGRNLPQESTVSTPRLSRKITVGECEKCLSYSRFWSKS